MSNFFNTYAPNLVKYQDEFIKALLQTFELIGKSGIFALILGLILGVTLVVTRKNGILENRVIYQMLDKFTNLFRSIPFIILLVLIKPVTKIIAGTSIGVNGAIFPLVVGCTPFFIRQVDMALSSIDSGLIEAAQSMGLSPFKIITRVYIKESIPGLARAVTITLVSLLGLSAMAGAVGGGGIGDFVLQYGHQRYYVDIQIASIISILLIVTLIETVGNIVIKKTTH